MRLIPFRWLVISSFVFALCARAATRPQYGGTLRIELRAAITSLDPAQEAPENGSVTPLLFDNLVFIGQDGTTQPQLATRWESENNSKRWRFRLRSRVVMHDGGKLTPQMVARSLTAALPGLKVSPTTDGVTIESESPAPGLLALLSLPRNAIVARDADGTTIGSGPFRVLEFQPGRRLLLQANDDYWNGRPYIDMAEIALGQPLRDQAMHLQLGRADIIEVSPDQVPRAKQDNQHAVTSMPCEVVAIVVPHGIGAAEDPRLREALTLAIDRGVIQTAILQHQGQPAASLLPQWISGYAFLFPTERDLTRARQLRAEAGKNQPPISLSYDSSDTVLRLIAERIAVNAGDAGIAVQPVAESQATRSGPRLVSIPLSSSDPQAALASIVQAVDSAQIPRVMGTASAEDFYHLERSLLEDRRILPIIDLPQCFVLGSRVRNWSPRSEGGLPIDNVWLEVTAK